MRILLQISYIGTQYHGWQVQPNAVTIQQLLQDAIEAVYGERYGVTGCSRTDTGVHAKEFCCHYDSDKFIPEKGIVAALNTHLPDDIRVFGCRFVSDDFHARYSSKGKNYVYRIYNSSVPNPFESNRSWQIAKPLDLDRMNSFASGLVGTHDFVAFSSSGRTTDDTVRTISECKFTRDGDYIILSVSANGFLYNMVRIIVGTAVDVSFGRIENPDPETILSSGDRALAGITAPPDGLYLNKVFY